MTSRFKFTCFACLLLLFCPPVNLFAVTEEQLLLEEKLFLLGEDFVYAPTKTLKKASDSPATITVISGEQIRQMGARYLRDVLKIVPGFAVSRSYHEVFWSIEARGKKSAASENILLLLNGHTLNWAYDGGISRLYNNLSVNNIEQIEIIRGPAAAIYGSNAVAGVINIITKKGKDIRGAEAKLAGGNFNTQQYSLLFGDQLDKFSYNGYMEYFDTEGPNLFFQQDALSPASFSVAPGYGHYGEKKTDLNLELSYGEFDLWVKYLERKDSPSTGSAYVLTDETVLPSTDLRGQLSYQHSFRNDIDFLIRAYDSYMTGRNYVEVYPEGTPGFPNGMIGHPTHSMNVVGGETKLDFHIKKVNTLTTGFIYEHTRNYNMHHYTNFDPITFAPLPGGYQDISSWGNVGEDIQRQLWALYLQNDLDLLDKYGIDLILGGRYDYYSIFGEAFTPRAGIVWRVSPDLDLKASYGRSFRVPSYDELYIKNNPIILGNPNLKPEKTWTVETGLNYKFSRKSSMAITFYRTHYSDLILAEAGRYQNTGKTKNIGVETEFKIDLSEGNYLFANYTYQQAKSGDQHAAFIPTHLANFGANFKLTDLLNSNTTVHFTGNRHRTTDDSRSPLRHYFTIDQTFILSQFYDNFELRASVYNLLNAKYSDPSPAATVQNDYPLAGINYLAEVAYKF